MTIKDFKAGQVAYLVENKKGKHQELEIRETAVSIIGRKYVTTREGLRFTDENERVDKYLDEVSEYSSNLKLFLTLDDVEEYKVRTNMVLWMRQKADRMWDKLSIEQLTQIYQIMGGKNG